jgi:hypothetical protein
MRNESRVSSNSLDVILRPRSSDSLVQLGIQDSLEDGRSQCDSDDLSNSAEELDEASTDSEAFA